MAFPQNFLDELIARNDIVDVVSSYVVIIIGIAKYIGVFIFNAIIYVFFLSCFL